jgi:hypothetical protein
MRIKLITIGAQNEDNIFVLIFINRKTYYIVMNKWSKLCSVVDFIMVKSAKNSAAGFSNIAKKCTKVFHPVDFVKGRPY